MIVGVFEFSWNRMSIWGEIVPLTLTWSFGVFGFSFLEENGDKIQGAKIDGVDPKFESISSGEYPLSRYLYMYVNQKPGTPLPPLEREFIKLVLSKEGQEVVAKDGYIPVAARTAERELKRIQ